MAGPRTKRKRAEIDNPSTSSRRRRSSGGGGAGNDGTGAEPSGSSKTADPTNKKSSNEKNDATTTMANKSNTNNDTLPEVPIPKKKEFKALISQPQKASPTNTTTTTTTTTKEAGGGGNDHAEEGTDSRAQPKSSLVEQNKQQQKGSSNIMEASVPKKRSMASDKAKRESSSRTPTPTTAGERRSASDNKEQQQSNPAEQSSSASTSSDPSRETKIRNLLEHRKILLQRVQQGRTAAKKRLDIIYGKDPTKKHETPEQEIAEFKEMGRVATSMARKHSRHDSLADGEKRTTSFSLRRGSSVGKRMNAALSSLAPGTAAASSSAASTSAPGGSGTNASTALSAGTGPATKTTATSSTAAAVLPADIKTKTQQRPHLPKRPSSTSAIPQKTAMFGAASKKAETSAPVVPPNKAALAAAAAAAARATTKKGSNAVQRQQQQQPLTSIAASTQRSAVAQTNLKKSASRGGVASGGGVATAPRAASITAFNKQQAGRLAANSAAAAAVAAASGSMALPNHRMQPPQQPSVSYPEAIALRERKKDIIGKLTSLLQARCEQQQRRGSSSPHHTSPTNSSSPGRDILSTMGVSAGVASQQPTPKAEIPPKVLEAAIKGPGEPSRLPRRRKTHWDYLLEEMRWLATDFIEERKWKICTNRVLSESVKSQERVVAASLRGTSEISSGKHNGAPDNIDVAGAALEVGDAAASDGSDNKDEHATEAVQKYAEASTEDLAKAQSVAGLLSSMVLELSTAIESAGVSSSGEADELSKALYRHQLTRKRLEGGESSPSNTCSVEKEYAKILKDRGGVEAMDTTSEFTGSDSNIPRDSSEKEKIFQRISDFVDGIIQKVKEQSSQSKGANLPGLSTSATAGQIKAIERIEDSWTRVESGTVLGGVLASGKTIVSCATIWKNSSDGPQLVICSGSNMIRWMHELGRFKGLKLRPIAAGAGISSPSPTLLPDTDTDYKGSDVVLCDFAAFSKLSKDTVAGFRSIVVDARYPRAYFGSRQPVCGDYENAMARSFAKAEMPSELTCSKWWSQLAIATAESQPNRLLIDSSSPGNTQQFLLGIPDRQLLEVLGLRLAFLLGSKNFLFPGYSLAKCILAWARRKIKNSDEKGTKFQRVKRLILNLTDSFYYEIEGGKCLEELSLHGSHPLSWDLRMCKMPELQRSAYDKACRESRASLSVTLTPLNDKIRCQSDPFVSFAEVLIHFRRLCIHSNGKALLSKAFSRHGDRSAVRCFQKKFGGCGPAQPDVELATSILQGSGKMRELMSILVDECGVEIANLDYLAQFFQKASRKSSSKGRHKGSTNHMDRVAVLASLPEAQLLASLLLNSVGIDHEVLFKPELTDTGFGTGGSIHVQPMAWVNCQIKLSRFNDDVKGASNLSCGLKRVVIGSLETVAGDNNGLGIESANVVISLDEDWSGRSELQMMSLGARCLSRSNSSKGETCRFIKLASADSCEQMFISMGESRNRPAHRGKVDCWPWPLEAKGSFSVPDKVVSDNSEVNDCWAAKEPAPGMFAFPACNILVLRNKDLSEVLSPSEPLQPLLYSQSDMLFLPRSDDGSGDVEIEMNLASRLASHEVCALYKITWRVNNESDCTWAFNTVSPPQPLDFPDNLVGRPDLTVLPSRLYLQRLLNDKSAWKLSITSDGATAAPPIDLMINGALSSDATDEAEQMVTDGLTGKPDELAASLLFYGGEQSIDEVKEETNLARRANSYSSIFSQSKCAPVANDGNSGSEPLVYFPPLFPRLLECSELARLGVETLRSQVGMASDVKKRSSDGSLMPDAKRPRIEAGSNVGGPGDPTKKQLALPQEKLTLDPRLITEDEASHNDAASVLFDLSDDFGLAGIGAVPLPRDSALTAANSSVQAGQTTRAAGEAGAWFSNARFPSDAEEAQAAGAKGSFNSELDSMVLFVSRKRPRGYNGLPGQQSPYLFPQGFHTRGGGVASGTLSGSFSSDLYPDLNGAGKKTKKKLANQKESNVGLSAFSRLPLTGRAKDMNRSRASVVSRYAGTANTLFEAPLFRAASLRVRTSVAERFERHGWTSGTAFEAGPGLPLLVSKQPAAFPPYQGLLQVDPNLWTSLVKRLKTKSSSTGDEAIELSMAQQLALRRSLVAPCRVDFGPFQIGFLSSPSGTTAVPPPRARAGISLPLGVKLPPYKEQIQPDWSPKDDRRLERNVEHFGMNWVLASSVMGGFQDVVYYSPRDRPEHDISRSARSCREHWMSLARAHPSLMTELKRPDPGADERNDAMEIDESSQKPDGGNRRLSVDNVTGMSTLIIDPDSKIEFLSPLPEDDEDDVDVETAKGPVDSPKESPTNAAEAPDEPPGKEPVPSSAATAKPRRTFNAIRSARAKKQVVPITIPGVPVGSGSPPAVVPSHPSHMQSVQSSVAAAWTNGRTEMWPLQLLEAADRHRATTTSTASVSSSSGPLSAVVTSSTSRPQPGPSRASSSSAASKPPPSLKGTSASAAGKRPSSRSSNYTAAPPNSAAAANKASIPRTAAAAGASYGSSSRNSSSTNTQTFKQPPVKPKPAVAQQPPSPAPPSSSTTTTQQPPKTKSKT